MNDNQSWEPGEETWFVVLLYPPPEDPVVASEFLKSLAETTIHCSFEMSTFAS